MSSKEGGVHGTFTVNLMKVKTSFPIPSAQIKHNEKTSKTNTIARKPIVRITKKRTS